MVFLHTLHPYERVAAKFMAHQGGSQPAGPSRAKQSPAGGSHLTQPSCGGGVNPLLTIALHLRLSLFFFGGYCVNLFTFQQQEYSSSVPINNNNNNNNNNREVTHNANSWL